VKEKAKFIESIFFPSVLLLIIWAIKIIENIFNLRLGTLGIYPLHLNGLPGILFAPLIHGDFSHLFTNSGPLLVLGTTVFYFYRPVAFRIIFLAWIMTGIWVWFGGREAYHIGASGLIYALASFLFFSGFIRRSIELMAISFVIVFLYGGMIWGIFPLRENISWESHLMGGVAGFILAIYYKDQGPQRKRFDWELEEDDPEEEL
jgi:membrane associated rhomboid family serine protease